MKRRNFVQGTLGVGAFALVAQKVWAMPMHGAKHDMAAMDHSQHGMAMGKSTALMPLEKMPSGLPLAALPVLRNESRQSGVFKATITAGETTLTLADRKPTKMWLYNGQVPGPQIVVNEGDTLEIRFKNNLPQPTTLHWHGLPVPADQDGHPMEPVEPGSERIYRFTLAKDCAGTYWYHPHPHELVSEQVAKGLAGSLVVRSKTDPLAHLTEQHWLISDLRLDADASIPRNTMLDWMNGREGQFVLINGQLNPKISLQGNERIRIWNACAARYLRLHIPNCQLVIVGTDGGLLEQPLAAQDDILLAPAERVEVVVLTNKAGTYSLLNRYYDRSKMMVKDQPIDSQLASVSIANKRSELPTKLRSIKALIAPVAYKNIEFSEVMDHSNGMGMSHLKQMFRVNGKVFDMDRIDETSQEGVVEQWRVFNNSHMDHPFHIHGTQFQVVSRILNKREVAEPYVAWKDTINLKPYETIIFNVVHHGKGMRMYHCHILEHETLGMMANLNVV